MNSRGVGRPHTAWGRLVAWTAARAGLGQCNESQRHWVLALVLITALSAVQSREVWAISAFHPPAGSIWAKISYSIWQADEQFAGPYGQGELDYGGGRAVGDRIPISIDEDGGSFVNQSLELSFRLTPIDRFSFGAYFPVFQTSALELPSTRVTTSGTGDVFSWLGYQIVGLEDVASSLNLHVKIPTTQTSFEVLSVPLSEGQVDIALEQVTTWAITPRLHLSGSLLYRYRFEVEQQVGGITAVVKPGNETELALELGGSPVDSLWLSVNYTGMFAATSEDRTLPTQIAPMERREIQNLNLGLYFAFGRWISPALTGLAIDAYARFPLAGVDYLAGPSIGAGLAWQLTPAL